MSDTEQQQHAKVCDCGNDEFYFVKDLNLDKAWKAGNKFSRICTDCGNRYFLSKAMYDAASDQYVILDGEDDPIPVFECPACGEQVTGTPDSCPYCDVEYGWPGQDGDEEEDSDEDQTPADADADAEATADAHADGGTPDDDDDDDDDTE